MKISAMFLPQFHADPFNDEWWGKGFTEWDNVKAARPLFDNHYQPRVPADGYFDLSDPTELVRQATLAKSWGIDAFSLYNYWYEGRQPLGRTLRVILDTREFDIPFSLCWANHDWTRSWTNRSGALDVLIRQTYPTDEASRAEHFDFLCNVFSDPRYIRIEGRPVLQIYDTASIPGDYVDAMRRSIAANIGTEPHLDAMITSWRSSWDHLGKFDSATLFQPSAALFSPEEIFSAPTSKLGFETRVRSAPIWLKRALYLIQDAMPNHIKTFDYSATWERLIAQFIASSANAPLPLNPMAFVDFDNTARYNARARIMRDFDVRVFEAGLRRLLGRSSSAKNIGYLFINAWNEWGEGAYLQPDTIGGFERLEAVQNAKSEKR